MKNVLKNKFKEQLIKTKLAAKKNKDKIVSGKSRGSSWDGKY